MPKGQKPDKGPDARAAHIEDKRRQLGDAVKAAVATNIPSPRPVGNMLANGRRRILPARHP